MTETLVKESEWLSPMAQQNVLVSHWEKIQSALFKGYFVQPHMWNLAVLLIVTLQTCLLWGNLYISVSHLVPLHFAVTHSLTGSIPMLQLPSCAQMLEWAWPGHAVTPPSSCLLSAILLRFNGHSLTEHRFFTFHCGQFGDSILSVLWVVHERLDFGRTTPKGI